MATQLSVRRRRLSGALVVSALAGLEAVATRLPAVLVAPAMMILLAVIDMLGAVAAKQWSTDRAPWTFVTGAVLSLLLFWVYGLSLNYGHLSTITLGWVVLVTVASLGLDAFVYDVHVPLRKWLAALAIVGLLVYLMRDDRGTPAHPAGQRTHDLRSDAGTTPS